MNEQMSIEVPVEMVDSLFDQFVDINRPERMHDLYAIRSAVADVLELFHDEPELIYDDEFYDKLVKTMAIKIALDERNCFYSS